MSTSNRPRQARAERTRAGIIDAAALAFAQRGFDGVSMNDLVAASGLTKGAFYFHFASKDDLAVATFRAKQQELIARLLGDEQPASARERIVMLFTRRAELLDDDPSLRVVSRLGPELNVRSAPGSAYASYADTAIELIAGTIADGQRAGEFRRELDPLAAGRAIYAWIVGLDTVSLLESGGRDLRQRSDEVLALLLAALEAPPRRRR